MLLESSQTHLASVYWIFNTFLFSFFFLFISSNKFAEKGREGNTVIQSKVSYKEHGLSVYAKQKKLLPFTFNVSFFISNFMRKRAFPSNYFSFFLLVIFYYSVTSFQKLAH